MTKIETYNKYITKAFNRRSGKELYTISGHSVLTEKEAIQMQIDLSTADKIILLEEVK